MTADFLIGAIRASRDLHPRVTTELEEILNKAEPMDPQRSKLNGEGRLFCGKCGSLIPRWGRYCSECGQAVKRQ